MWSVEVPYAALKQPEAMEVKWAFSTTGGTTKIAQALSHVASYGMQLTSGPGAGGYAAPPNHYGTIGVDEDGNVEGCEVVIPNFKWTETWQLPGAMVPFGYTQTCEQLTGSVNQATFRNRNAGCVRFDGTEGMQSIKTSNIVEITYSFASTPAVIPINAPNIQDSSGNPPQASGWQYVWFEYQTIADSNANRRAETAPRRTRRAPVYNATDFSQLLIGTGPLSTMGT